MELIKANINDYIKIEEIYEEAFPYEERFPFELLKKNDEHCQMMVLKDKDNILGFTYLLMNNDLIHIFFLAIKKEYRAKGYGGTIIEMIKELYPNYRLFLALEAIDENSENYTQRIKRRDFYLKHGFDYLDFKILERDLKYDVMAIGDVKGVEYDLLVDYWVDLNTKYLYNMGFE